MKKPAKKPVKKVQRRRRVSNVVSIVNQSSFPAAELNRLTGDWSRTSYSPDSEIRFNLQSLRAGIRNLYATNDYARRFVKMCSINVIGKDGILLRNKAQDFRLDKKTGALSPTLDKRANRLIEENFWKWGQKGNCTVDGQLSFKDACRLMIETIARDGEIVIREVAGFDNPWNFAIQLLEADHLDEGKTEILSNGNQIIMSKELDRFGKPVAFHLLKKHPGNTMFGVTKEYDRVPADEIIHPFVIERASQSRGLPWMYTAATRLNHIGAYEMAALVHARIGASAMGIFTSPDGTPFPGAKDGKGVYKGGTKDGRGNMIVEVSPGQFINAPYGTDFKEFKPNYPDSEFPYFIKSMLRGVAASIGVSYNSLASDLESVNYSSLRTGANEEQDGWRVIQNWFIENIMNRIFSKWLKFALLTGQVPLPYAGYNKFNSPEWRPRGFDWPDPSKDIDADLKAINEGLETRTSVCAKRGIDFEENLETLAAEQKLIEKHKVIIASLIKPPEPSAPAENPEPKEPPKEDGVKALTEVFVNAFGQMFTTIKDIVPKENNAAIESFTKMHGETLQALEKIAGRETKVENNIEVQPAAAPIVTVNTPDVKVENKIEVQPAAVTVPAQPVTLDVKLEQPKQKKTVNIKIEKDRLGNIAGIKREES